MKIELGRYSDILRRLLGGAGAQLVASELAPELQAAIVLENDRPEYLFLGGQRLCAGYADVAGVLAERSIVEFRNPDGSGVLAVIMGIVSSQGNEIGEILLMDGTTALGTAKITTARSLDYRVADRPGCELRSDTVAQSGNVIGLFEGTHAYAGTGVSRWLMPIILPPGTRIYWMPGGDNTFHHSGVVWRERPIGKQERA